MKKFWKSIIKRSCWGIWTLILFGSVTLLGCAPSAEDALMNADSYIAEGNLEEAEGMLLETLEREPENVAVRAKMSEIYRQQAITKTTVTEALECFGKAQEYDLEFDYTVEELTFLCNIALETNDNKKEILELCNENALEGKENVSDELYVDLGISVAMDEDSAITGKLALEELYNITPCDEILQAWVRLDIGSQIDYQAYVEELNLCRTENNAKCSVLRFELPDVKEGNLLDHDMYAYNELGNVVYASRAFVPGGGINPSLSRDVTYTYDEFGNVIHVESVALTKVDLFYDENNMWVAYARSGEKVTNFNKEMSAAGNGYKTIELTPGEQYLVESDWEYRELFICCEGKEIISGYLFTTGNTVEVVKLSTEEATGEKGFTEYANQKYQILERDASGNVVYEITCEYDQYGMLKKEVCKDYVLNTEECLYYVTEEIEAEKILTRVPVSIDWKETSGTYHISADMENAHVSICNNIEYDLYYTYLSGVPTHYEIYCFE